MSENKTLQKIDVFISSPSDVQAERDAIYAIVTAINEEPSVRERYVLKPLAYERLVPPEVGDKPQKVVDKYMREAGKADLFIGVLWSRMGTPVVDDDGTEYQSGTEYEFRKAYEARTSARGKPIMLLYRSLQSIPVTADFEQIGRVQAFFKRFEGDAADFKGLYKTYTSLDEFKTLIRQHLLEVLAQIDPDADDVQPVIPTRRRADHYQHIPLPTNYVERTELLTELRKALIGDSSEVALTSALKSTTPQNPTALHGMGGIGKSVMARALCDDPQVHAAFPDGILWATCGQTPNLVQQLRGWIKAFNEMPDDKAELEDLKAHAAKLLASRACLLIIDDVWDKAHAQAFRVGGANCRTIITTRDEMIAEELGAKIERIPPMSEPDAINLLELWGKDNLAAVSHADKAKVVNRVGRLALAIKLAGGQLMRQSVDDWFKGFDVHKLKSRRPNSSNPHDSLEVCFGLSLSQLAAEDRRLYAALSIFREDESILERAVAKLWDAYGDSDPSTTSDLIDDLGARALLEITAQTYPRAFILHDLLRDFMNSELGSNRTVAHEALISAYAETKTDGNWPSAPDDGYLYTHLAYHLHEAGRTAELYALLTASPAWMEAKFIACIGDRAYVDDLELAISDFHDPLTADQVLTLTKLWTARQVVNARVNMYEDIDLQTLVWMGRTQEAIAHATLRPDDLKRVYGLLAIAEAQNFRHISHNDMLQKAFENAHFIEDIYHRTDALWYIAAAFARASRFDEAISIVHTMEDTFSHNNILCDIAVALTQARNFNEALTIARTIEDAASRSVALSGIAAAFTQADQNASAIFSEALTIARTIEDAASRSVALSGIAAAFTQADQNASAIFSEALTIARTIENDTFRIDALCNIAVTLTQIGQDATQIFSEVLLTAQGIVGAIYRSNAMRSIAIAFAKADLLAQALKTAQDIEGVSRNGALHHIAIAFVKANLVDEALNIVRMIEDPSSRARVLREISAALAKMDQNAEQIFSEALAISRTIEKSSSHTNTVHTIAIILTKSGLVDEALITARIIDESLAHSSTLRDVVIILAQAGRLDEALIIAKSIVGVNFRADAFRAVAVALDQEGQIFEALGIVRSIKHDYYRAKALCDIAIARVRAGQSATHILHEALTTARIIEDSFYHDDVLCSIAIVFAKLGQSDEALTLARSIGHIQYRTSALCSIAASLAQINKLNEALNIVRSIEKFDDSVEPLHDIACALAQTGRFDEAIAIAHTIERTYHRVASLRDIGTSLVQVGQDATLIFGEAINLITNPIDRSFRPFENIRTETVNSIATSLANLSKFTQAFTILGFLEMSEYFQLLALWYDGFKSIQHNSTLVILRETTRIIAWEKPQWRDIHAILVRATTS